MTNLGETKPQDVSFATVLNCMDGRVQLPVNEAVRSIFGVSHVDTITEAGIVRFLSDQTDSPETRAALSSVGVSVDRHGSRGVGVAAHHDCVGNPCSDEAQQEQVQRAVQFLKNHFPACKIVGLWVRDEGKGEIVRISAEA